MTYLKCKGGTKPAQLMYQELADMACERITAAITRSLVGTSPIKAVLDPYNPVGSTAHVKFNTSRTDRWQTDARKCHVNWVILDSDWEAEFCRVAESHPRVKAYVKNHNLGLEVPYRYGSETRKYLPDFIVLVDDGHGERRPSASDRRDQRLPARRRQGEEGHHGHLLGAGREQQRPVRPLGVRRVHRRLPDPGRLRSQSRIRVQQDDRVRPRAASRVATSMAKKTPKPEKKKTVETLTHEEASRKNIPTAEFQSVMHKEEQSPIRSHTSAATAIWTRNWSGAARTSRTGPIWSRTRRRSTSRKRFIPRF